MAVLFAAALCIAFARGGDCVKAFTSDRGDGTFPIPSYFPMYQMRILSGLGMPII